MKKEKSNKYKELYDFVEFISGVQKLIDLVD